MSLGYQLKWFKSRFVHCIGVEPEHVYPKIRVHVVVGKQLTTTNTARTQDIIPKC